MSFDVSLIAELLKDHGIDVTIKMRNSEGTVTPSYDIATGSVARIDKDYFVRGYTYRTNPTSISDATLLTGDSKLVCFNKQTNGEVLPKPSSTDQVLVADKLYDIVKVSVIRSSGNALCYILQMRD